MSAASALREPWDELGRQREAASFGMWVFLGSELLFFGGLFTVYAVYRVLHPDAFTEAAREANLVYGTVNTAILMTSSFTMALAARTAKAGYRRLAMWSLALTITLGFAFLIVKGFEYSEDIQKSLIPGADFKLRDAAAQLFWAFYWIATGVHALHLTIGIGAVSRLWLLSWWRELPLQESPASEATALYWHLVDVVWIFLFPAIYLVGRNS
ncbi:MAG: cytochrome c oxidase subunit 3 family protein [Geminicoccaceae bacterium]